MNVVGLVIMAGFFFLFGNPFALILFIIGLFTAVGDSAVGGAGSSQRRCRLALAC